MNTIAKIIGERLRQRRLSLGYSQETTSEKAGLHPTYIGQLERGEKNATLESIYKVCVALNYPLDELFEKIVLGDGKESYANKCYSLITTQSAKEQELIFNLLANIIEYKQI